MQIIHLKNTLEIYVFLRLDHIFTTIKILESFTSLKYGCTLLVINNRLETIDTYILLMGVISIVRTCLEVYKMAVIKIIAICQLSFDLGIMASDFWSMNGLLG